MKSTNIIRRIDDLGRVVIPKEIRREMHILEGTPFEIYLHEDMVCFKKYNHGKDYINALLKIKDDMIHDDICNYSYDMTNKIDEVVEMLKGENQ